MARKGFDWLANSDPSWHAKVLQKLQDKYPDLAEEIWGEVIGENARKMVERMATPGPEIGGFISGAQVNVNHENARRKRVAESEKGGQE